MDLKLSETSRSTTRPGGDKIAELLAGAYRRRDTGEALRVATWSLVMAPSLAGMEAEGVGALEFGRRVAVVSDETTHSVMGRGSNGRLPVVTTSPASFCRAGRRRTKRRSTPFERRPRRSMR